jgi:hypothetical protein
MDSPKRVINRGVDFILNGGKKKEQPVPKTFHLVFGKLVGFFKWEVDLYLEFSLDFKKRISHKEE